MHGSSHLVPWQNKRSTFYTARGAGPIVLRLHLHNMRDSSVLLRPYHPAGIAHQATLIPMLLYRCRNVHNAPCTGFHINTSHKSCNKRALRLNKATYSSIRIMCRR